MSTKPLAESLERLKELRREGGLTAEIQSRIGHQLRSMYDDVVRQGVPERFEELKRKLDGLSDADIGTSDRSANLVAVLEIKALADRVFADEGKAGAWLQRPNRALSGQKPVDLLQDELGTSVVRELLEQIDHGIFA